MDKLVRKSGSVRYLLVLAGLLAMCHPAVVADESDERAGKVRHNLDVGVSFLDSEEFDSLSGIVSYTFNLNPRNNFTVSVPYLNSDFSSDGGSGIGDMELVYAWSPGQDISAAPWVPKRAGSGMVVVVPTGNADDGRSLDTTILIPFLGLLMQISDSLYLNPNFSVAYSLDQTNSGDYVELAIAELGLTWLGRNGSWAGIYQSYLRDFDASEDYFNYRIEAGKVFSNGIGFSAFYANLEHFVPGSIPSERDVIDHMISINLHFVF
jgi:hypothetical protein